MLTFGFSAFLKLLCLSDRRQRSEIKGRLIGRSGGYDFHRSLKRICRSYSDGQIDMARGLGIAEAIGKIPERRSARVGFENFVRWRGEQLVEPPVIASTYESPTSRYRVNFTPDFCHRIDGRVAAVHIWNTATPILEDRMTFVALHLAANGYAESTARPQDLAVLNLRTAALVRLSGATVPAEIADLFAIRLDELFAEVEQEISELSERPDHRPDPLFPQ